MPGTGRDSGRLRFQPWAGPRGKVAIHLALVLGVAFSAGWPDIVVANYGEESGHRQGYRLHRESYVYWGAPDGYSAERRTSIPTLSAISCAVGDFDGDGWADLAFANNNLEHQSLSLHWGSSAGFDGARQLDLEAGNPRLVRAADLDLDGTDELVVFSGKTRSAFFDADRTERSNLDSGSAGLLLFQISERPSLGRPRRLPAEEVREVIARDLNGDGHVDLTLAGQVADQGSEVTGSALYWGSGAGFDPGRRTVLPTLSPGSVASADLNRDGHIDLVFANAETSKTHDPPSHIYWGSEKGFHPARRSHLQGFGAVGVTAADLNRDGHPEIVLMNRLSGRKAGEIPSLIFWGNSAHHYSEAKAVESVHISPICRRIEQLCTSKSRKSGLDSPLSRYDHFYRADSWFPATTRRSRPGAFPSSSIGAAPGPATKTAAGPNFRRNHPAASSCWT